MAKGRVARLVGDTGWICFTSKYETQTTGETCRGGRSR